MKSKRVKKEIERLKKQAMGSVYSIKKNAKNNADKMTWPEKEFCKILKELKVSYETQKIIQNKIYDFYIPGINMLVEIHGCYWHGNGAIYKEEDLNGLQKKNQRNDVYKEGLAKTAGYSFEVVWETDLKKNYKEVKERMKNLIKG